MLDILVVGSVNVDYVLNTPTLPNAGETLSGRDFAVFGGGKGANQAVACARLGASTALVACVGDDSAGRERLVALSEEGIDTSHIDRIADHATGSAMIFVADNGENCIGICAGANSALDASRVTSKLLSLATARFLLVQLETPIEGIAQAIEASRDNNTTVILNPAPAAAIAPEILADVDILTPNQTEAAMLTGLACDSLENVASVAERLHEMGPRIVIITLGAEGAWVCDNGESYHVPASETERVIDTVAAGDTFNGGLAVALSERRPLKAAVEFANRAAAIAVSRPGAQSSVPYRREL